MDPLTKSQPTTEASQALANDSPQVSPQSTAQSIDVELAAVLEAWPLLPEALRIGIVAMIGATKAEGKQ